MGKEPRTLAFNALELPDEYENNEIYGVIHVDQEVKVKSSLHLENRDC